MFMLCYIPFPPGYQLVVVLVVSWHLRYSWPLAGCVVSLKGETRCQLAVIAIWRDTSSVCRQLSHSIYTCSYHLLNIYIIHSTPYALQPLTGFAFNLCVFLFSFKKECLSTFRVYYVWDYSAWENYIVHSQYCVCVFICFEKFGLLIYIRSFSTAKCACSPASVRLLYFRSERISTKFRNRFEAHMGYSGSPSVAFSLRGQIHVCPRWPQELE